MKKTFIVFVAIVLVYSFPFPVLASITPTITANVPIALADFWPGSVTVSEGTDVVVAIGLEHSEDSDLNVDYWAILQNEGDFYHLNLSTGLWESGIEATFQGAILNLPEYPIFQGQLPVGDYTYYFGVDTEMNGQLDMEHIQYDSIDVTVLNYFSGAVEIKKSYPPWNQNMIGGDIEVDAVVEGANFTPSSFFYWTMDGPNGEHIERYAQSHFHEYVTSIGDYTISVQVFNYNEPTPRLSTEYSFSVIDPTVIEGVTLSRDTTISIDNSPYKINGTIQIPDNITLTIEPGVEIYGGLVIAWGTLNILGDSENKIQLYDVTLTTGLRGNGTIINISFANMSLNPLRTSFSTGYAEYNIYDSVFYGGVFSVNNSVNDSFFERNIFVDCPIVFSGDQHGGLIVKNNNFIGNSGVFFRPCLQTTSISIERNSFMSNEEKAIIIGPGSTLEELDISLNYWGTTDPDLINQMIYDHNDYYGLMTTVDYLPLLMSPHGATPDPTPYME